MKYIVIDPVIADLGFVKVYWYGVMYLLAFLSAYLLARYRIKSELLWNMKHVDDLIFFQNAYAHPFQNALVCLSRVLQAVDEHAHRSLLAGRPGERRDLVTHLFARAAERGERGNVSDFGDVHVVWLDLIM